MSARIAKGKSTRAAPRKRGATQARRRPSPSLLDSVGLPSGTGRRVAGWLVAMALILAGIASLLALQVPQQVGLALAEAIGRAGFEMRRVEIKGAQRVSRLDVYNVAFDQPGMAMPLVDLETTRERLLGFGWVKEARVHRRLPDTLVIQIVERTPVALWQRENALHLVDGEGVVLEPVRIENMPDLPLVIGEGANRQLAALAALFEQAPHLRPQVASATWVGARRWNLRFSTGELLALPEGQEAAFRALRNFARMDQQTQLLGRGFARFDMRIPGRFIVRVTREPGSTVPVTPPAGAAAPADLSRTI